MPKDACYHKVKARYKVFPSDMLQELLQNVEKLGPQTMALVVKRKRKQWVVD